MKQPRFGLDEHQVFWSEAGVVACACCHVPYPGSDTWVREGWVEITPEMVAEIGVTVTCEGCGKAPSRIVVVGSR